MIPFQVKEFGKIRSLKDHPYFLSTESEIAIPDSTFNSIWDFILSYQEQDAAIEKAFKIYTKSGKRIIQAQNYVGIIQTASGDTIEILPKIFSAEGELTNSLSKNIFLKMLATVKDSPFINMQEAAIDTLADFPIIEVFISIYLTACEKLLIFGLKKDYLPKEENSAFIKGKILFSKSISKNLFNKSRTNILFQAHIEDIPENRLIYSTLLKLNEISKSINNKRRISTLLNFFGSASRSTNYESDFQKTKGKRNRLFKHYEKLLGWSEVFLLNRNFTNFSGKNINQALLFPMEVIFENFISKLFRQYKTSYRMHFQHSEFFLVNRHEERGKFRLKPDIFGKPNSEEVKSIVIDTKWKVLDQGKPHKNYFISQADMYQLYAYGKKYTKGYGEPRLILIYPRNTNFTEELSSFYYEETDGKYHLELRAIPFDLTGSYFSQLQSILQESVK